MNPFNIAYIKNAEPEIKLKVSAPLIIEGADIYDVLCPVSQKTGHRENPVSLLARVLSPDKSVLAARILQEIPAIQQENPNISDSDAIDLCVSRFSSGTPFEDGVMRQQLLSVADVLFPGQEVSNVVPEVQSDQAVVVDNV